MVVGLGVSGYAAANALADIGAQVSVVEDASGPALEERARLLRARGVEVETGGHGLVERGADVAVVSPGIPPSAPVVERLGAAKVPIIGEVELAFRLAECDFLAVTGTNGKTTTTALLAAMLAESGIESAAAGNIGLPLVDAVAKVPRGGAIAVEVSSFQLAAIEKFRPRVGVILNIAEDHTDWHGSLEAYARAKGRIFLNQRASDIAMPNLEDDRAMELARGARGRVVCFSTRLAPRDGIGVEHGALVWRGDGVIPTTRIRLPGAAGLEDTVAAAGAALEYGVDRDSVVRAIEGFQPLPHRLEVVGEVAGVTYIDDSKATNPHATLAAVRGLDDVVLIAGGRSKGIDLTPLAAAAPPVVGVVALGEAADAVAAAFAERVPVVRVNSMDDAVARAAEMANGRGSVLLSPACASLDMYENYAARGEAFARAVTRVARAEED